MARSNGIKAVNSGHPHHCEPRNSETPTEGTHDVHALILGRAQTAAGVF